MTEMLNKEFSRKTLVKGGGALIVGFSLAGAGLAGKASAAESPFASNPPDAGQVDAWVVIHEDNTASIRTGYQELGQGTGTGMLMLAGEELDMEMSQLKFVYEDTNVTPKSLASNGGNGISKNGLQVRAATAVAKQHLLSLASASLGVPVASLTVKSGVVSGGGKSVTYGNLLGGKLFNVTIPPSYNLTNANASISRPPPGVVNGAPGTKPVSQYTLVGTRVPRIDIPDKVTGTYTYAHNVRVPGMLHGRVVWPRGQRSYGAGAPVLSVDESSIKHITGARVVRRGDLVGVVAPTEYAAIQAANQLKVKWADPPSLPSNGNLFKQMREHDSAGKAPARSVINTGNVDTALASAAHVVSQTYSFPYNGHHALGPCCNVAHVTPNGAVIYTNSQDLFGLRTRLSTALGLPENLIRLRYFEGGGTFGQSPGRYEGPQAAAIMSQVAGAPVRLQFMRWDEHGYDNFGPAILVDSRGGVDANGKIVAIDHTYFSQVSSTGQDTVRKLAGLPGGNDADPYWVTDMTGSQYTIPNWRVLGKRLPVLDGYLKTGPLRRPYTVAIGFAVEQFMDELAYAAKMDPVAFRRQNVQTANTHPQANFLWLQSFDVSNIISNKDRWLGVLDAITQASNWKPRVAASKLSNANVVTGRGIGFGGGGNQGTTLEYAAAVADIEVNKKTGKILVKHLYSTLDVGLVVGPDLVENQAIGQTTQAVSRTLLEEVRFDQKAVTGLDWVTYPILRFKDAPQITHVSINRPNVPTGQASEEIMGAVPAAIANAFFDATGVRMRTAPMTPARVRTVLKAAGVA